MKKLFILLTLLTTCITSHVFAAAQLERVLVNGHNPTMQLTYGLSGKVNGTHTILSNPNRFVVDLDDTRDTNPHTHTYQHGLIKAIRFGQHDNHLRIVVDLREAAQVTETRWIKLKHSYHLNYYLRATAANTPPSATPPKRSRDIIVVIDPGHGGKDPGATGPNGTHEKTVVLKIGKLLYHDINAVPGFKAYMTRYGDYYITLRGRLAIARKHHADFFIAIHADSFPNKHVGGASVFALSLHGATSEAARWLAERENASELHGDVDLADKSYFLRSTLISLSQQATISTSLNIGYDIIHQIGKFAELHSHRVDQAAFVVLKSPDIPSLLVETAFITNPSEERKLESPVFREKMAHALATGIVSYFKNHPPRGTELAAELDHDAH